MFVSLHLDRNGRFDHHQGRAYFETYPWDTTLDRNDKRDMGMLQLEQDMAGGRGRRLEQLGFSSGEAETLAALHTRNFM